MMVGRLLFILCSSWAVAASAQGNTCGTLGSLTFSVPSGYIYFPMERVGDVWAKNQPGQDPANCERKIQTVTLESYYPSLSPATGFNQHNDPNKKHIAVTVTLLSGVSRTHTFDATVARYTGEMERLGPVSALVSNGFTGLDGIDPVYRKGPFKLYWKPATGPSSELVECRYYPDNPRATDTCKLSYFLDRVPAVVTMRFAAALLDDREKLKTASLQLIERFSSNE